MRRGYQVYLGTCMIIQDCLFNIRHYSQCTLSSAWYIALSRYNLLVCWLVSFVCFCCCSVFKLCLTLYQPMDCSMSGSSVLPYLPELAQIHDHFVSDTIWTSHLLLLLSSSIFPRIRVFSKELDVQIRWPKYWSFSLSNKLSSEFSGFISFRIDWFDLLAVQGTLKSLLQHHNSKASIFSALTLLYGPTLTSIRDYWKNHSFDYVNIFRKMSLFFNTLSSQGASIFISWLQLSSSDFRERKSVTASTFSSSICHEGTGCHDLSFLMLSFMSAFSLSFFTFIKRLFSSSLPLGWYTSEYLILLIFLLVILILAYRFIKSIISHDVLCL